MRVLYCQPRRGLSCCLCKLRRNDPPGYSTCMPPRIQYSTYGRLKPGQWHDSLHNDEVLQRAVALRRMWYHLGHLFHAIRVGQCQESQRFSPSKRSQERELWTATTRWVEDAYACLRPMTLCAPVLPVVTTNFGPWAEGINFSWSLHWKNGKGMQATFRNCAKCVHSEALKGVPLYGS